MSAISRSKAFTNNQDNQTNLHAYKNAAKFNRKNAMPFKATGHKGGISRQGSKRG
ncbi:hypothetical protein [Bifidobacterium oedipodis]|uniref:Uncharacterized protein n=1 Tax=Bifidobacterium oedipodis TaxID=2675322 RepID=A0A7Y0EQK0_9BIFI|nr:hypothetical protein [Bifidobacterium sp. DSM 109957]NMM94602.1 hypothetical protein [Bifidobacterium sp. DSM 109957]